MADNTVRTYDPKKVVVIFGGVIFSGFAEGTFIVRAPSSGPAFEKVRGADGGVDRVNKNSNDYTISVTLKRTSPTNAALSAILNADKASNTGKFPLIIKDLNGTDLFTAPQAWIQDDPSAEESDSMPNREWNFDTGIASNVVGGSNS
jgi:hypothetical protein